MGKNEEIIETRVRSNKPAQSSDYRNDPKYSDRQVWANSADPDQTAHTGAV